MVNYILPTGEIRPASGDRPSASRIYRNTIAADGFPKAIAATTLHELFQDSVAKFGPNNALGWRPIGPDGKAGPYQWLTYSETAERVAAIAAALAGLGITTGQSVGVYGANSAEWMTAMQVRLNARVLWCCARRLRRLHLRRQQLCWCLRAACSRVAAHPLAQCAVRSCRMCSCHARCNLPAPSPCCAASRRCCARRRATA